MAGVFISYRRQDSAGWAGRLHDQLVTRLGEDRVFMDVATLLPGEDYSNAITRTLDTCDTVLLLVGPDWADATDEQGRRRLDDPTDLHREEVRLALERSIPTVPVLVDGADAPDAEVLPDDLTRLARRHAIEVNPTGFQRQVDELVDQLGLDDAKRAGRRTSRPGSSGWFPRRRLGVLAGAAVAAAAVLVGVVLVGGNDEGNADGVTSIGDTFQYQLAELPIDQSVDADVIDVDLFETPISTIETMHDDGRTVICYMSAGSFEGVRPDADRFPDEALGDPVAGFEEEQWLDIRLLDDLLPIMEDRLDLCVEKGFDAVEFDNVDGFTNETGFDLTAADQQTYLEALNDAAHERGLTTGLKNALLLVPDLAEKFDFSVVEQCVQFNECDLTQPFLALDKPVFIVEYEIELDDACAARPDGATMILKDLDLGPSVERCP